MTTVAGLTAIVAATVWALAVLRDVHHASICRLLREKALR